MKISYRGRTLYHQAVKPDSVSPDLSLTRLGTTPISKLSETDALGKLALSKEIERALKPVAVQLQVEIFKNKIVPLAAQLKEAAAAASDKVIDKFFKTIASNYFGVGADSDARRDLGTVWLSLNDAYVSRKRKDGRAPGFFRYNRVMDRAFKNRSGLSKLGSTAVTVKESAASAKAVITIRPAPRIFGKNPGQNFTSRGVDEVFLRVGAITQREYEKLSGKDSFYRALLWPALQMTIRRNINKAVLGAVSQFGGFRPPGYKENK